MPETAFYFLTTMRTQLAVWDIVMDQASPFVPTGISPSPSPSSSTAVPHGLIGAVSMAPVDKLLRARDLPYWMPRGHDFQTSSVSDCGTFHKVSCALDCPGHGDELPAGRPDFQLYTVLWGADPRLYRWGAGNTMPPTLPEDIRRGLLMANKCEWSVFLLKPTVEKIIKLIDPDAEVLWMMVVPRRRFQLVTPDRPGSTNLRHIASAHSVIFIRSPLAGNFVLDPTAEQYGNPREHRFLAWRDYKDRYILRKGKWLGNAVWTTDHDFEQRFEEWPGSSTQYWKDARRAVEDSTSIWLQGMQEGGISLRAAIDDQERHDRENKALKVRIMMKMRQVPTRPFWA